jgi:hypothetical protein
VGNVPVIGRKNFGISVSEGFIHVTGGTNQFGTLLDDLWTYNTQLSKWSEIKVQNTLPANGKKA